MTRWRYRMLVFMPFAVFVGRGLGVVRRKASQCEMGSVADDKPVVVSITRLWSITHNNSSDRGCVGSWNQYDRDATVPVL
jgi:hypothetical protein